MRCSFILGFSAAVAVVVPLSWHELSASIQRDGRRVRSLQQTLQLDDGARVTLDVDRAIVITGDTVHATLRAFSAVPRPVAVDVWVFQSQNHAGERVEPPQVAIDHEKLVLAATPDGGAPVVTALALGKRYNRPALSDSFTVYVTAHGTKVPRGDDSRGYDLHAGLEAGKAAAVGIAGWSGDSLAMTIRPLGRVTSDAPFKVAVRVKNTSGKTIHGQPWIRLGTKIGLSGGVETGEDDFTIDEPEQADVDDDDHAFAAGAVVEKTFVVTPKHPTKDVTFIADAEAASSDLGPVAAGAMDVVSFPVVTGSAVAVSFAVK
jgi:hypothetical protein